MKLFGGNRYGVMAASNVSFGSSLGSEIQPFDTSQLKMYHCLALMGHQNISGHHNTNHWSHILGIFSHIFLTPTQRTKQSRHQTVIAGLLFRID
jgi:hypothetical protein